MNAMTSVNLLLVDDHLNFLNGAMRALRKYGWINIAGMATNGLEAITEAENLRPDVVLMDLNMPEMGGLQATRLIKAQDNPPFIIIASHFDDGDHKELARRAGADAFVSKLTFVADVVKILTEQQACAGVAGEVDVADQLAGEPV